MLYHGKPAIYVGSVQLKVERLESALAFYRNILGFRVLEQTKNRVKLTADGRTSILSLVQPEDVVPKVERRAGLYHFALLLPDRSDLANLVLHLSTQGVCFGSAHHLVSEAIYFEDPDGNGIEVYADTDSDTWVWTPEGVEMATVPLDFDDLLKERTGPKVPFELPATTIIGHIHLHVSHLEDSEAFYTKGLGFEIATRFRDSALFLSTSKYHHHIALNTWNGVGALPNPVNSVGLDFFTLLFPDDDTRQKAMVNLEMMGATLEQKDGRTIAVDPSGNAIILLLQEGIQ